ncbi:MAG: DUF333 domain-containing protein [Candidatus Falkowbacteria bacterium]|nr:DUF333 domain-containing protein [Candidatus Falkowbacteria bacterium]
MKTKHLKLIVIGAIVLLALGARLVLVLVNRINSNKVETPIVSQPSTTPQDSPATTIANPASTNCVAKGGQTIIQKRPDGAEYGLCMFEDNRACEEWALLRGYCPAGGMRTTGYDTIAQKFCAWSGGQTIAADNAVCTFKDGSTCDDQAFYEGNCQLKGKTN